MCLPEGELCETDSECCVGICVRPPAPPGAMFAYPKRCLTGSGGACRPDGASCVDKSQCCNGICVLHSDQQYHCGPAYPDGGAPPDGGMGPDGGAGCVPSGGACTTGSDCCSQNTCVPTGAGGLVCAGVIT